MISQRDKAKWGQFSIMHLLAVISIAGILFAVIQLSLLPGLMRPTIVGSAYGLRITWQHKRHSATESVAGGVVGGITGLLAVLIYVYASPEPWEDEGLGLLGCLVLFLPFACYAGAIVSVLLWAVGTGLRVIINGSRISE